MVHNKQGTNRSPIVRNEVQIQNRTKKKMDNNEMTEPVV